MEALIDLFVPVISSWWMAEVGSEEISSWDKFFIILNILSFSPLAFIEASSLDISFNTFVNEFNVCGHVCWSTVVVLWDQVRTNVPDADVDVAVAFVSICLRDTLSPEILSNLGTVSILDWVAELFSEERIFLFSIGINPCALIKSNANSLVITLEAWITVFRQLTSISGWDNPFTPSFNWSGDCGIFLALPHASLIIPGGIRTLNGNVYIGCWCWAIR
jgi:hypothetical protein